MPWIMLLNQYIDMPANAIKHSSKTYLHIWHKVQLSHFQLSLLIGSILVCADKHVEWTWFWQSVQSTSDEISPDFLHRLQQAKKKKKGNLYNHINGILHSKWCLYSTVLFTGNLKWVPEFFLEKILLFIVEWSNGKEIVLRSEILSLANG